MLVSGNSSGAGHLRHTESRTVKKFRSRCSSVGIVTSLRAGRSGVRDTSFLQSVQTVSGAHPPSWVPGFFPGAKAAEA
jgi:hypothetical protein